MKEGLEVDGLDALLVAGRRLLEVDPERFYRVLAIARTYVSIYDREDEDEAVFSSRLDEIAPRNPKASA